MKHERNKYFDMLKFVGVVLVVAIHATSFIYIEKRVTFINFSIYRNLLDIAVPLFFAISGFFIYRKEGKELLSYIKRITILYALSSLVYILYRITRETIHAILTQGSLGVVISQELSSVSISSIIGGTFGYYHLWYLAYLIIACLIIYFFKSIKYSNAKIFIIFVVTYISVLTNIIKLPELFSFSGGIFHALAYISLGMLVHQSQLKDKKLSQNSTKNFTFFIILMVIYSTLSWTGLVNMMPVVLFMAVYYLLIAVANLKPKQDTKTSPIWQYSLWVYVLHSLFLDIIISIYRAIGIDRLSYYPINIIITIFASVLLSLIFAKPAEKLLNKFTVLISKN